MKLGEIEIIDNFLAEEEFDKIYDTIVSSDINWIRQPVLPDEIYAEDPKYNLQFVHPIYGMHQVQSELFFDLIQILKPKLKIRQFYKIKANCVLCNSKILTHGFHNDMNFSYSNENLDGVKTAILYLNTNNGFTVFEDGRKINSVENRMIVFPASMKHSGTTCTDTKERLVINFNYF